MIKPLLLILFLCGAVGGCAVSASTDDNVGYAYKLPPDRPIVKNITITTNPGTGAPDPYKPPESQEECSDFILKESDVHEFFDSARAVIYRTYEHSLLISSCYVGGTATLKDGRKAVWAIERYKRGFLRTEDDISYYFFCFKCSSEKYGETCDINDNRCIDGEDETPAPEERK